MDIKRSEAWHRGTPIVPPAVPLPPLLGPAGQSAPPAAPTPVNPAIVNDLVIDVDFNERVLITYPLLARILADLGWVKS